MPSMLAQSESSSSLQNKTELCLLMHRIHTKRAPSYIYFYDFTRLLSVVTAVVFVKQRISSIVSLRLVS